MGTSDGNAPPQETPDMSFLSQLISRKNRHTVREEKRTVTMSDILHPLCVVNGKHGGIVTQVHGSDCKVVYCIDRASGALRTRWMSLSEVYVFDVETQISEQAEAARQAMFQAYAAGGLGVGR